MRAVQRLHGIWSDFRKWVSGQSHRCFDKIPCWLIASATLTRIHPLAQVGRETERYRPHRRGA